MVNIPIFFSQSPFYLSLVNFIIERPLLFIQLLKYFSLNIEIN